MCVNGVAGEGCHGGSDAYFYLKTSRRQSGADFDDGGVRMFGEWSQLTENEIQGWARQNWVKEGDNLVVCDVTAKIRRRRCRSQFQDQKASCYCSFYVVLPS